MTLESVIIWIKGFTNKYLNIANDREEEAETIAAIKQGIEFRGSSVWILIFAIFVASLGLNTNSTAVIIGAMLISPLMGPIMGVGLGLGINDFDLIKRSFLNLAVATLFSIITSTLYFAISPLNEARSELLARTAPTIYDVLIALFGGAAGIVALSSRSKGQVIPGVAIATALMPPLCTAGFGLATGNMTFFIGAFYLYCINSIFISFATTLGVKFMKFSKKEFIDKQRETKVKRIVYTILILTVVPSLVITWRMVKQNLFETVAYRYINEQLQFPDTQIIDKKLLTVDGDKEIEVTLIGKEVNADQIAQAENNMSLYGLKKTRLIVKQGFTRNDVDVTNLNGLVFKDIYAENQKRIEKQAFQIDSLSSELVRMRELDSISVMIAPEIKILFPDVQDIAISRTINSDVINMRIDTVTLAVVRYQRPLSLRDQEQFKEWLMARLNKNNVELVVSKY